MTVSYDSALMTMDCDICEAHFQAETPADMGIFIKLLEQFQVDHEHGG
jgi:hypothetical protein